MSLIRVRDADRKSLAEIGARIGGDAEAHRAGHESTVNRNKYLLSRIPWPFRRWVVRLLSWLIGEVGVEIRRLGLSDEAFGSVVLSNIGVFGLTHAVPALFPVARLPAVVAMGKIEEKPVVRDGQVVIRSMLPLTASFDHRLTDAEQIGRAVASVARFMAKPELFAGESVAPLDG
jgi:pyruvate dehydrogenase E2 component (dihydrolipoamide acetyltransferase)